MIQKEDGEGQEWERDGWRDTCADNAGTRVKLFVVNEHACFQHILLVLIVVLVKSFHFFSFFFFFFYVCLFTYIVWEPR